MAAPHPPPLGLNGTTNPCGLPGLRCAQLDNVVFPGARPVMSDYKLIKVFLKKKNLLDNNQESFFLKLIITIDQETNGS